MGRSNTAGPHYSRWEIGEEPQLGEGAAGWAANYSRWKIGEEPQHMGSLMWTSGYYSRWEIGEEPQPYQGRTGRLLIIADGRSRRNRNQGIALRCIPLL